MASVKGIDILLASLYTTYESLYPNRNKTGPDVDMLTGSDSERESIDLQQGVQVTQDEWLADHFDDIVNPDPCNQYCKCARRPSKDSEYVRFITLH